MIDSDITHLQPWVAQRAQAWLEMAQAYVLPLQFPGCKVRITETRRSLAQQAADASSGASSVTVGYHQFGRAFDFACMDEHGVLIADGAHPIYQALGNLGEMLGLYSGRRFMAKLEDGTVVPNPDYDHLEDRSHGTIAELQARQAAGLET